MPQVLEQSLFLFFAGLVVCTFSVFLLFLACHHGVSASSPRIGGGGGPSSYSVASLSSLQESDQHPEEEDDDDDEKNDAK